MSPALAPPSRGRLARLAWVGLGVVLLLGSVEPAFAFRLMNWNLLNYPTASGSTREDDMRAVIGAVGPDLIVCQEIVGLSGANQFLSNVLNVIEPSQWTRATFSNSNDTERALYYRTSSFTEIAHGQLFTTPRTIDWWRLRPAGYASSEAELVVYTLHLKASSGVDNENERNAAALALRAHLETLPAGTNFVVAGDFNIYSSAEPAWNTLTGSSGTNAGRVFDPINRVGNWHNSASFADVHTQSTRTANLVDGGSTGGMDDRFDFVLANDDLLDGDGFDLEVSTYTAYGQDGLHFNLPVNASPTNAAVGQAMADNLHAASDHLPLFVDFQLPSQLLATVDLDFGQVLQGTLLPGLNIDIENSAPAGSDDLDVTLSIAAPFVVSPSQFSVLPGATASPNVSLDTSNLGSVGTQLVAVTDAPGSSLVLFPATAKVVRAAVPSLDGVSQVLGAQVDFGSHVVGEFSNQTFDVHNLGADSLQAGLEVFDAEFDGVDADRFSLVGFAPTVVGETPESFTVAFDDAGAVAGTTYTAQIFLSTQDDASVQGASARPALVIDLEAVVQNEETAAPLVPVGRTRLLQNVPNPFNPRTEIQFELARESRVRVVVYSAQGRVVRELVDEVLPTGVHRRVWDGRAEDGTEVASGVYFVRMHGDRETQVRRAVLLR